MKHYHVTNLNTGRRLGTFTLVTALEAEVELCWWGRFYAGWQSLVLAIEPCSEAHEEATA